MSAPALKPDDEVTVFVEMNDGGQHVFSGPFVMMDETGVLIRNGRMKTIFQFFPMSRIAMIEKKEV